MRPGYPADYVIKHTLTSQNNPPSGVKRRILDVGCGTGKWTAILATALTRAGVEFDLEAADPVPSMTAVFAKQLAGVPIHTAVAGALLFNDAQFELVTAATAFHWFYDETSVQCVHRLLKPTGFLAIITNNLTLRNDWTLPMQELFDSYHSPNTPRPEHGRSRGVS